jgi:WhiB family redox-sensing transcriptional regulator
VFENAVAPRPLISDWEWQEKSACRDLPTEMFFHPDGERGPRRRNRENTAKAVCATCPVMMQCREQSIALQEPYGIWGGLSEDERFAMIRARQLKVLNSPISRGVSDLPESSQPAQLPEAFPSAS